MGFLKLALMIALTVCHVAYTLVQGEVHFSVPIERIEQMCQEKEIPWNDTRLTVPHYKVHELYEQLLTQMLDQINKTPNADLFEIVNSSCEDPNLEQLIRNFLNAILLCFDEKNHLSPDEIKNIVDKSVQTLCFYQTFASFSITHGDCVDEKLFEECLDLTFPDALYSHLLPLPVSFSSEQCNQIWRVWNCRTKIIKKSCESSIFDQYESNILNKAEFITGCLRPT